MSWREVARAIRDAAVGERTLELLGQRVRVAPSARGMTADRDYEVLLALAAGRRCLWDVGANIGLTSVLGARALADDGRVVAFEASEEACRLVERHAALNDVADRVTVVEAVVGARSGRVVDFHWDHASGGASVIEGYLGHRRALGKVTLALDDYVGALDDDVGALDDDIGALPDVVKLDVEGAERDALEGARELLRAARPVLLVELHSWDGTTLAENAAGVLEVLDAVDYQMIYLRTRERVRDAAVLADRGRCHVLLQPAGEPLPRSLDDVDTSPL